MNTTYYYVLSNKSYKIMKTKFFFEIFYGSQINTVKIKN